METLIAYLDSIYPLSDGVKDYLLTNLQHREVKRKDYLLKAGHISRNIYFIEQGLFRCFYMQQNQEVCSWFMKEGDVITSVESFFDQKESYESIQALEEGSVYFISYQQLSYIYKNFMEFNYIGRELLQKYYKLSEQRLYSLRMQRGLERFEHLKINHPLLIQKVEQKYLASYLGVTEQYLSMLKGIGPKKKKSIS